MSKLLPCPFCGGQASTTKGRESFAHRAVFKAFCLDCQNRTMSADSRVAAESLWNRRYAPDGWQCVPKRMDRAMMSAAIPNDQCNFPDYRAQEYEMQARYIRALSAAPSPNDTPSHTAETTDNQESAK